MELTPPETTFLCPFGGYFPEDKPALLWFESGLLGVMWLDGQVACCAPKDGVPFCCTICKTLCGEVGSLCHGEISTELNTSMSCDHVVLSLLTWKTLGGVQGRSHPSVCRKKHLEGAQLTNRGDILVVAFGVSYLLYAFLIWVVKIGCIVHEKFIYIYIYIYIYFFFFWMLETNISIKVTSKILANI